MKFPKLSLPKFFSFSHFEIKHHKLFRTWKKFLRQIPREFRSGIKTHQHFLVLGEEKSGKSGLIRGIVEQSQNIYPFEVEYTQNPDMQFYLGPKQVIQEVSLSIVKDRTIGLRKALIYLWKRLYRKKAPIVLIAYNCWSSSAKNAQEANQLARLIAGKLSLLSEIAKDPLKIRVALTHLDQVEGYLEFTRFLKQHNLSFEIPLVSNFESAALEHALAVFREKYLPLILTSVPADDFLKILNFFNELPAFFTPLEEFLRALTTGNISHQLELEKLTLSTHMEPHSALASFDWAIVESNSIFFRHPMLKHQIACATLLILCCSVILNNFFKDKLHVALTKNGVDSLVYLQPQVFIDEVIPQIEHLNLTRPQVGYLPFLPRFYKRELKETKEHLAMRIRKHMLEPELRKIMLKDQPEVKILYMLGLLHATPHNRLGYHILKNIGDFSKMLGLDERLIKTFVVSNLGLENNPLGIEGLDKINTPSPLTSANSWISFLTHFQDIVNQPVFTGQNFEEIRCEATHLLSEYRRIKLDPHAFVICNLLKEANTKMLQGFAKNIQILGWLEENNDLIESFLIFVCETSPKIPDISQLNVSQFFSRLKDIAGLMTQENRSYNFLLGGEKFSFETSKWVSLATTHNIERLIHHYIVVNNDTQGDIFFKHTPILPDQVFESYRNEFPSFKEPIVVGGRYSRLAFEKNVRHTSESLLKLLELMPINSEDKDRFTQFIKKEVMSYAKRYQKEYERVYAACDIKASSLEDVKDILKKILETSSSFQHFLSKVNHNTEVFSDPPACLNELSEINHFNFLRTLISQEKNKQSPFDQYKSLVEEVLVQLKGEAKNGSLHQLDGYITPTAQIALSILRNDPDSCLNQITDNLLEIGVPSHYHFLFTAPVMQLYHIGVKDLKKGIDKLWAESLEPELASLFAKRPFNPQGAIAATFEEVRQVTAPTSNTWALIKQIASPVSVISEGMWYPRASSDLQLLPAFYANINHLAQISLTLWDQEGNPKPIKLKVQSLPFESSGHAYPMPILSYLITGGESFHNFNQSPTWHPIQVDWWKENDSAVVVELINKNENKSYQDEKVSKTLWSFFELLKKASPQEKNVWCWELGNKMGEKASKIALRFETDPWELFNTNTYPVSQ